jgi:alanine racemase
MTTVDKSARGAAYIDLQAIRHNIRGIRAELSATTNLLAVVKTDGYGHGAVAVALAVQDMVSFYAVATGDEAISLRNGGVTKPVLILGYVHESYYEELMEKDIRPCCYSLETAKKMSAQAVALGKRMKVHLKVDTGMGRLGFQVNPQGIEEAVAACRLPGLEMEGIFTHFATADETDKSGTERQIQRYDFFCSELNKQGITFPIYHVANSAAILDLPEQGRSMARVGIAMYGYYPSDEVRKDRVKLRPALSLKSQVIHIKWMEEGDTVSYGATYQVHGRRRIATVPIGYGDGYPRSLSNRGYVLICGKRAPICGRVCMDQMMVDITDIPEASLNTEVTLIGKDGTEEITAAGLGELSGRFHYELLCDLNPRIPRIYVESV